MTNTNLQVLNDEELEIVSGGKTTIQLVLLDMLTRFERKTDCIKSDITIKKR